MLRHSTVLIVFSNLSALLAADDALPLRPFVDRQRQAVVQAGLPCALEFEDVTATYPPFSRPGVETWSNSHGFWFDGSRVVVRKHDQTYNPDYWTVSSGVLGESEKTLLVQNKLLATFVRESPATLMHLSGDVAYRIDFQNGLDVTAGLIPHDVVLNPGLIPSVYSDDMAGEIVLHGPEVSEYGQRYSGENHFEMEAGRYEMSVAVFLEGDRIVRMEYLTGLRKGDDHFEPGQETVQWVEATFPAVNGIKFPKVVKRESRERGDLAGRLTRTFSVASIDDPSMLRLDLLEFVTPNSKIVESTHMDAEEYIRQRETLKVRPTGRWFFRFLVLNGVAGVLLLVWLLRRRGDS